MARIPFDKEKKKKTEASLILLYILILISLPALILLLVSSIYDIQMVVIRKKWFRFLFLV